jgi:hypothetical protein
MPHLDKTGPESKGSKTGRKLGLCKKNESEKEKMGELGKGQGKRRHSGSGEGKKKRLKYNK